MPKRASGEVAQLRIVRGELSGILPMAVVRKKSWVHTEPTQERKPDVI